LAAILPVACAGPGPERLPPLVAATPDSAAARCAACFPQGRWQMLHAIDFHLADGTDGNAMGIVVLDGRSLSCALMTVEGLTLFEARSPVDGSLEVLRALPPFDGPAFAAGLVADIRTLFLPPAGTAEYGRLADGSPLCRFTAERTVTDLLPGADGCFRLSTYARSPASGADFPVRSRTVEARDCGPAGGGTLPREVRLTGYAPAAYTLNLHLLEAELLPASAP
jgi:hypothetical protein